MLIIILQAPYYVIREYVQQCFFNTEKPIQFITSFIHEKIQGGIVLY